MAELAVLMGLARLDAEGYSVEKLDCGFGPITNAWVLRDPDGASLQIGEYGEVAPTQRAAVAEGLRRLEVG